MTNLTHDDYLLLAFITAHPDDDKARAYQIGYASGLKAKSEELSPLIEKLIQDFNPKAREETIKSVVKSQLS